MSDKNNLAEERTNWAEDRTVLANERTFAGWMRTGMASVALALGLRALFGPFEPTWVPKAVASIFILVAVLIFWAAWRNSCRTQKEMNEHATNSQTNRSMTVITGILSAGAIATGILLWYL
ncbi:DUF202 domain-containing protein [Marivita sp. S6314]|uniref:YidH family protein n=1 Tax=Marivita sp. S6314 TaxID=2926406 RepID=UPI001FF5A732|nr:DUF202 domain-containing protein [Marivita sp. S6314]MCK0149642.1 DUF202 domain-containing protein [Marivita sp. S6314]